MHLLELECVVGSTMVQVVAQTGDEQRQALEVGEVTFEAARLKSGQEKVREIDRSGRLFDRDISDSNKRRIQAMAVQ